jgi:hypothetical protein
MISGITAWTAPFAGLIYFLGRPRMWGHLLLGLFFSAASLLGSFLIPTFLFTHKNWFYAVGWGLFGVILDFIIIIPFFLNLFFYRALVNEQKRDGKEGREEGFINSIVSSFIVFYKTLRWRILWPLFMLVCLFYAPPLVLPVSLLAASHLFALESADLVLAVRGIPTRERVLWIKENAWDLWRIALSASALAFILSFLVILGWLFWFPSIPVGLYLYTKNLKR